MKIFFVIGDSAFFWTLIREFQFPCDARDLLILKTFIRDFIHLLYFQFVIREFTKKVSVVRD